MTERACATCGKTLGSQNTSGYCNPCGNRVRIYNRIERVCFGCGDPMGETGSNRCLTCQHKADSPVFAPQPRRWCVQCQRNVLVAEAEGCRSPWCSAKVAA